LRGQDAGLSKEAIMRLALNRNIDTYGLAIGNYIVLVMAALVFAIQFSYDPHKEYLNALVLRGYSISSLLGYMWLHTGLAHVLESLVMLWLLGRHVCSKVGNANYFLAYVLMGIAAAIVHCSCDGREVIGASGAIMGVLGMYVVLCFTRLSRAGPWILLIWFLLSLTCGIAAFTPIADMGHCGGFLSGVVIAIVLVFFGAANSDETDPVLARVLRNANHKNQIKRANA
jgi:membrane associated rhomboid family serine protease